MSDNPIVSVIIPVYNTGEVLRETVDSVLQQTFADFELILIDDGSSDPVTEKILDSLQDPRIRVIRQDNAGVAAARNRGCAEARGKYISFLDHDDLFLPEKLLESKKLLDENPTAVIAYSDIIPFGEYAENAIKLASAESIDITVLLEQNRIYSMSCVVVKSDIVKKSGIVFDSQCVPCDDWDFYLHCACKGQIIRSKQALVKYRIHGNNQSANMLKMYCAGIYVLHKVLHKIDVISVETGISKRRLRKAARYALAEHHYGIVFQYLQKKCSLTCAIGNAVKAFFYHPFSGKITGYFRKKIFSNKN